MQGKIIKGIAGFYYVYAENHQVYECKAKGAFRKEKVKPLVGDNVCIDVLDDTERTGNLIEIYERKNELIRPAVANVDQALVLFAAASPEPNLNLLDRFLIMMRRQHIPVIVCFNKLDLIGEEEQERLFHIYEKADCSLQFISVRSWKDTDAQSELLRIREMLEYKTTVLAGPSGVGKSSLMNVLQPKAEMETGSVSEKIQRGKHTTRHSELICVSEGTYVMDTPGFSSLMVDDIEKEEVKDFYPEFEPYLGECRFLGCNHLQEPGCMVKQALENGEISRSRYENYTQIFDEVKNKRKW
ncbi:MAG: ribosome small subunit-dependent GTPase A [Lachnospiraceae bacterium]